MSIDVADVISNLGIEVSKRTDKELIACCPFHDDKSPSFAVNADSGLWNCFVCGGGTLLDLVLKLKGTDLDEAVQYISTKQLNQRFFASLEESIALKQDEYHPLPMQVLEHFNFEETYSYMLNRGFSLQEIKRWHLGIDDKDKSIVIPAFYKGELYGIIKRRLFSEPRYWNSPGAWKRRIVFGYDMFQPQDGWVNVCEGTLDCIWLHQNGYRNTVATLGVGISEQQYTLLKYLGNGLRICYDNDVAGRAAADKIYRKYNREMPVETIRLPDNVKDVQEVNELQTVIVEAYKKSLGD